MERNHSQLLGMMAGEGGDYYIGTQAVTTKKFSHIKVGTDGATLVGVQRMGVDVMTARNYPSAMPGGYIMCAGDNGYFDYIEFSSGYAQGSVLSDDDIEK